MTDGANLTPKDMDEIWEMNIQLNPIDEEMKKILNNHKRQLIGGMDNFVSYIKHTENERLLNIKQNIFLSKLQKFNKYNNVLELYLKEEYAKQLTSRNESKLITGTGNTDGSNTQMSHSSTNKSHMLSAMEEEAKVIDLNSMAKTSVTVNMDPNRFRCILNSTSNRVKNPHRMYLQALPEHVKEEDLKKQGADQSSNFIKIPRRKFDHALDPEKVEHVEF